VIFATQAPPPSPAPGLILIASIFGAFFDWRYKRNGGKKSNKRDRIMFLIAVLLVVALFSILIVIGGSPEILADAVLPLVIILFGSWELGRWRIRRKNPISGAAQAGQQ
jgi:drug/metabolite transporter (DMT)-like permease